MLLIFQFESVNNIPVPDKLIKSDYKPEIDDVIDFREHLRTVGLIELPSDFIITEITFRLNGSNEIEAIITCNSYHQ
jgi:hypothetical protein